MVLSEANVWENKQTAELCIAELGIAAACTHGAVPPTPLQASIDTVDQLTFIKNEPVLYKQ